MAIATMWLAAACVAIAVAWITPSAVLRAAEAESLAFETHIRPIFRAHCFDCHGATDEKEGQLDLRLVRLQVEGGDSGPAIVPGDPAASYLIERVRAGEMPPGETKLSADEIDLLERWVAAGAPTAAPEPDSIGPGIGITREERAWWAFQPLARPPVPALDDERIRTPIDALLVAAMPAGLSFSPDAEPATLVRRVYFDLVGLPPTPEQLEAHLADWSEAAYERLVEELLDSPHYGERWARHWLDAAGYADSEGATAQDAVRPWAYRYRDWVIRALNADLPLDRFLTEQLAGDELAGPQQGEWTPEQIELLEATGFLRMAADGTGSGDNSPEARNQVIADTLEIVGTALLGLTVGCAQCHDHRYDPIPQADYFALRAVLAPAWDWEQWRTPAERQISLYTALDRAQAAEIEAAAQAIAAERAEKLAAFMAAALEEELARHDESLREPLRAAYLAAADERTDEQRQLLEQYPSININPGNLYQYNAAAAEELKQMDARIAEVRATKPREEFIRALSEPPGHLPATHLFHRGDYRQPREEIAPAGLSVLAPEDAPPVFAPDDAALPTSGRRLALARWLTSTEQPLTARVLANRVWMHHFGRGLVETPGDFGRLGMPPSHPELLDWLADELRAGGWSLKALHRAIVRSTAYRQSSYRDAQRADIDPANHYYWRQNVVRLDAEAFYDRVLATSGALDRSLHGPPQGVREDDTGQVTIEGEPARRAIYLQQRRSQPIALLEAFDAPVMRTNCQRRSSSTVATQSLMLLNGELLLAQAARFAARVQDDAVSSPALPAAAAALVAQVEPLPLPEPPAWQYGWGTWDTASDRVAEFQPFGHWTGSSWQAGPELPDPAHGWVLLSAAGGHPGAGLDHAVVRRWIAPADGTLAIRGALEHGSENGDGVHGRIVSSRAGSIGEWLVHHGAAETAIESLTVAAGDTIDLVVDCQAHETSDSFTWRVELTLEREGQPTATWDSAAQFAGPAAAVTPLDVTHLARAWQRAYLRWPAPEELELAADFVRRQMTYLRAHPQQVASGHSPEQQALTNLCQVLLSSSEFLYVD